MRILRLFLLLAAILLLTALTQVGGAILLLTVLLARLLRWRVLGAATLFVLTYAVASLLIVPPLAAFGGRVPLPCMGEKLRTLPLLCALNRHYVTPRLQELATDLAAALDVEYPGTVTVSLDANFPFFDGFPLLPHLSHDDGRKLDLSYYYSDASGTYLPGATRSPVGYWAFETPAKGEATNCPASWPTSRWNLELLEPLFAPYPMEQSRTRMALDWLTRVGPAYGLQRIFLEPYLAQRLGARSPLVGFQGCRAARHDDHIHLQIEAGED